MDWVFQLHKRKYNKIPREKGYGNNPNHRQQLQRHRVPNQSERQRPEPTVNLTIQNP